MPEKADSQPKTSGERISRREGLKLGPASAVTSLLPLSALAATQTESPFQKEKTMAENTAIRPFHFRGPASRPRRLAQSRQGNQVTGARTGHGCIARRPARNHAKARAILGKLARLAQVQHPRSTWLAIGKRSVSPTASSVSSVSRVSAPSIGMRTLCAISSTL
jgi:hypothetical protein